MADSLDDLRSCIAAAMTERGISETLDALREVLGDPGVLAPVIAQALAAGRTSTTSATPPRRQTPKAKAPAPPRRAPAPAPKRNGAARASPATIDPPNDGKARAISWRGERMSGAAWAKRLGVSRPAIMRRVRLGLPLDAEISGRGRGRHRAAAEARASAPAPSPAADPAARKQADPVNRAGGPPLTGDSVVRIGGETKSVGAWAAERGLALGDVLAKFASGRSAEAALS